MQSLLFETSAQDVIGMWVEQCRCQSSGEETLENEQLVAVANEVSVEGPSP